MNRSTSNVRRAVAGGRRAAGARRAQSARHHADWGALTKELGGDKVNVYVATTALQDVHRVEAKPSLVARARNADLVVATGAELEIGWLPVLMQESGNCRIQPGGPGYFEAASASAPAGSADAGRPRDGRHPSARQSARAARSAQHRDWSRTR